jgi:transposase
VTRDRGSTYEAIAKITGFTVGWVSHLLERFDLYGEAGLVDRREENGPLKADAKYLATLYRVVEKPSLSWGWNRPTWTRELLILTLEKETSIRISCPTMSRALAAIGASRKRARGIAICRWSKAARTRRLREISRLIETLPDDEIAFWADEVDVHLNPKIGLDWMLEGYQREIPTPGDNEKRHIAGAMHVKTKKFTWTWGENRNSRLFIDLMHVLCRTFRRYRVIHLIVDNAAYHCPDKSKQIRISLEALRGRVVLHYLPTYSPDDNPIERKWQDFHADVTRNHRCKTMQQLMNSADDYLWGINLGLDREVLRIAG